MAISKLYKLPKWSNLDMFCMAWAFTLVEVGQKGTFINIGLLLLFVMYPFLMQDIRYLRKKRKSKKNENST